MKPDLAEAYSNFAVAIVSVGEYGEAWKCYERALAVKADLASAVWNQSLLMLLQGDFKRGWQGYEWRWKKGDERPRDFSQPKWEGEPLGGKRILVHAEQGLGDTIQFIRYAILLKEKGDTVLFECQPALTKILSFCDGIDTLIPYGEVLPNFDFYSPLLSLPRVFDTSIETIPSHVPYLSADHALVVEWRSRFAGMEGFRVGINWHGRENHFEARKRDIPLEPLASLAKIQGVRLISLQKGQRQRDFATSQGRLPIVDLGDFDTLHGAFMDTAAIMMDLDLVITSDTSVAHLAGALGVPVWTLLPFVPDWRWLLERSDSPWYPTMRLFRQKSPGDWAGVLEEVSEALRQKVSESNR